MKKIFELNNSLQKSSFETNQWFIEDFFLSGSAEKNEKIEKFS
jgi:hypothetical protein